MPSVWIERSQDWRQHELGMIKGRTLGIFGFGAIGSALAPRAVALGMKVLVVRASGRPIDIDGVELVDDIGALIERCDDLVLAAPATDDTIGIVDAGLLARAKPGLHLINLARGSLIDDDALVAALDDGSIGLASLDVTVPEPLPDGHVFYSHPRIRLSPHVSASTTESLDNLVARIADNLNRYRQRLPLLDVVDPSTPY